MPLRSASLVLLVAGAEVAAGGLFGAGAHAANSTPITNPLEIRLKFEIRIGCTCYGI
ncbi:MAG: hypothetical protein HC853_14345 [Anaerolineae bacterium]|nr:hypothetical protein [Anaerolineae bacterium]